MYGDAAKKENGWAFDYLPKVDREYSWVHIFDDMLKGQVKGLIAFGMNSVAIGPNSQKNIDALKKAEFWWSAISIPKRPATSGGLPVSRRRR
jgi:formate dehydrogenase major subunit